jgi:tRNA G18 (ribose-2'-O)-methylase SpoU
LGITPLPTHPKVQKTALGGQNSITWSHHQTIQDLLPVLKDLNCRLIALETLDSAQSIYQLSDTNQPTCLVLGNEVTGVSAEILSVSDHVAKIPLLGKKESLNVAVAAGIAVYEFRRKSILGVGLGHPGDPSITRDDRI